MCTAPLAQPSGPVHISVHSSVHVQTTIKGGRLPDTATIAGSTVARSPRVGLNVLLNGPPTNGACGRRRHALESDPVMPDAELSSTAKPNVSLLPRKTPRRPVRALLVLASVLGIGSSVMVVARPAAADQISDAKAQAASITAKLQSIQGQEQALTGQVEQADYQLSQIQSQIAANHAAKDKDQAAVDRDMTQLRTEAIHDYTNSGQNNEDTAMFSSNVNVSGIRSEYSNIATGNATVIIDNLHSDQSKLQAAESALQKQSSQAAATRDGLQSSESQAATLANQYQSTLNGVNSQIQTLVAQQQAAQQAAAEAAARAAFTAQVAASQQAQAATTTTTSGGGGGGGGASTDGGSGGNGGGGGGGGGNAGPPPNLAAGAAGAIQAAESQIGVPYVWGGESPGVGFDCSGLVQWAYAQVGIGLPRTSGAQYGATVQIPLSAMEPGDLLFYGPGGSDHVAMYVGGGSMIEAPSTGQTVHITAVRTGDGFAGVGRVG